MIRRLLTLTAVIFAAWAESAAADPIRITAHQLFASGGASVFDEIGRFLVSASDQRSEQEALTTGVDVSATGRLSDNPPDPFLNSNHAAAQATVSATIGDTRFSGNGEAIASATGRNAGVGAGAQLTVDFHLDTPAEFSYAGMFSTDGDAIIRNFDALRMTSGGFASLQGLDGSSAVFSFRAPRGFGVPVSRTGLLGAGDYRFATGCRRSSERRRSGPCPRT